MKWLPKLPNEICGRSQYFYTFMMKLSSVLKTRHFFKNLNFSTRGTS